MEVWEFLFLTFANDNIALKSFKAVFLNSYPGLLTVCKSFPLAAISQIFSAVLVSDHFQKNVFVYFFSHETLTYESFKLKTGIWLDTLLSKEPILNGTSWHFVISIKAETHSVVDAPFLQLDLWKVFTSKTTELSSENLYLISQHVVQYVFNNIWGKWTSGGQNGKLNWNGNQWQRALWSD